MEALRRLAAVEAAVTLAVPAVEIPVGGIPAEAAGIRGLS
jgi:hypothetical protein